MVLHLTANKKIIENLWKPVQPVIITLSQVTLLAWTMKVPDHDTMKTTAASTGIKMENMTRDWYQPPEDLANFITRLEQKVQKMIKYHHSTNVYSECVSNIVAALDCFCVWTFRSGKVRGTMLQTPRRNIEHTKHKRSDLVALHDRTITNLFLLSRSTQAEILVWSKAGTSRYAGCGVCVLSAGDLAPATVTCWVTILLYSSIHTLHEKH